MKAKSNNVQSTSSVNCIATKGTSSMSATTRAQRISLLVMFCLLTNLFFRNSRRCPDEQPEIEV